VSFAGGIGEDSKTRNALIGNSVSRAHHMKLRFGLEMANPWPRAASN
jgi:hypothetical protein